MKELLSVWRQEYRNIAADKGVIMLFVVAVFFYSVFYPIPYSNEVLKKAPVAVVDLDHTAMSRKLARMADANESINIVARPETQAEAERLFFERKVHGILIIPHDFERKILRKEQATVTAYSDASYFLLYRQIMGGFTQACGTLSAGIEIKRMQAVGFAEDQAREARDPLPLTTVALFNPSGGYASYVVPAVLVIILQQTLLMGIGMLGGTAHEERMRVASGIAAPGRVVPTVLGKAAAYFSIYLFNAAYYLAVLPRFYRLPQRVAPLDLVLLVLPFLLAVIFMGIALSGLFRHREASMLALLFTSLPSLFLVGFSWPKESIPSWLRGLSYLLPSTAGIDGLLRVNQMGASLSDIRFDWLMLWGLTAIYFSMACISGHFRALSHHDCKVEV
jgi:ABC-2 type transport system permease protein